MNKVNDGSRSIIGSVSNSAVKFSLKKWIDSGFNEKCVLIGGLAYSYYARPRETQDIDFLYLHKDDIPQFVPGFKRNRPSAFTENVKQVEIEVCTPALFPNVPMTLAKKVFDTAVMSSGLNIASIEGLIALKLCAGRTRDDGDIVELLKVKPEAKLSDWHLTEIQLAKLIALKVRAVQEVIEEQEIQNRSL